MTAYLTTKNILLFTNAGWLSIGEYVVSDIHIKTGMATEKYDDRIAEVGTMKFTVNNQDELFSETGNLKKGTLVLVILRWYSQEKVFYGFIERSKVSAGTQPPYNIEIETVDWMGIALKHKPRNIVVEEDQRIDQAASTLLTLMAVQPIMLSFDEGEQVFPLVFDNMKMGKTSVYDELHSLTMSELGYTYIKNDGSLRIENATARKGTAIVQPQQYTIEASDPVEILNDDASGFVFEDTGTGVVIVSDATVQIYDGTFNRFIDSNLVYGENVINEVDFEVQPRQVDMGIGVYYQLYTYNLYDENPPIPIPALGTLTLRGKYPEATANGKTPDAAMDVQTPTDLGPSDFNFVGNPGTGLPNLSSNLVFTFVGGADGWYWSIFNDGPLGYITYMEWVGRPIYRQQPLNLIAEDETSQKLTDRQGITIHQQYMESLDLAREEAPKILDEEKTPRTILRDITLNANYNANEMAAFMLTDIGTLRNVEFIRPALNQDYWVQGMDITVGRNKSLFYTLKLKEQLSFHSGLDPLGIKFAGVADSQNMLFTDSPPLVLADLSQKTICFWIYVNTSLVAAPIISKSDGVAGYEVYVMGTGKLKFTHAYNTAWGVWETTGTHVPTEAWAHVAISYNRGSLSNDPIIYVAGEPKPTTETTAPAGSFTSHKEIPLNIGNQNWPGFERLYNFNGVLKDIRFYSRILSDAEVLELATAPNVYTNIQNGLVFHAAGVRNDRTEDYMSLSTSLTPNQKIVDSIYGIRMTPFSNPASDTYKMKAVDPSLTSY